MFGRNRSVPILQEPNLGGNRRTVPIGSVNTERPGWLVHIVNKKKTREEYALHDVVMLPSASHTWLKINGAKIPECMKLNYIQYNSYFFILFSITERWNCFHIYRVKIKIHFCTNEFYFCLEIRIFFRIVFLFTLGSCMAFNLLPWAKAKMLRSASHWQ
jgi:hypothetical protein